MLTRTPPQLVSYFSATTIPYNNALVVRPGFSFVSHHTSSSPKSVQQQSHISNRRTPFQLMSTVTSQDADTEPIQFDDLDFSNNEPLGDMQSSMDEASARTTTTVTRNVESSRPIHPQTAAGQKNYQETIGRRIRANVRETGFDSMKYYMKTMGNHDLLQKNEEIILAREIQILIKWEELRDELESELLRWVPHFFISQNCLQITIIWLTIFNVCINIYLLLFIQATYVSGMGKRHQTRHDCHSN